MQKNLQIRLFFVTLQLKVLSIQDEQQRRNQHSQRDKGHHAEVLPLREHKRIFHHYHRYLRLHRIVGGMVVAWGT
jgi:hypothetical protein